MTKRIVLEIDQSAFERLLAGRGLSLTEFSCLDAATKRTVHDMYLSLGNPTVHGAMQTD